MKIACIGEAMIELSMDGAAAQIGVAGDTLNTAIYLHRVAPDCQVEYITCLGDDPFSDRIAEFISRAGIGTGAIRRISGAQAGLYAITTTPEGERSFTYWRESSAARRLFSDHAFDVLSDYDAVYFSGISLAILPHAVRLALIDWLARASVTVIYDSNYRPRLWENLHIARDVTRAMWARAEIALPSIDDEMTLFSEDAAAVTARFSAHPGTGALKRGAQGPLSIGEPVSQTYTAAPHVVDTTAAGDSFNAGYLGTVLTSGDQARALMVGHDLASRVVQHRGAIIPG
ncbi:sugar kinase [Sulfitobacter albidus]|uniref:Sugar kinase n=1 Tax=Sulfitobacter albidus TaxID=2829501 RepID=A0A975PPB0_9RHOB|nr:sugar kinase [Sulfitobacter albidus]QUJ78170.1 sugar kinase [Sulfitobacter albidus]